MDNQTLLMAAVFVPTVGAFLMPLLARTGTGLRNVVALGLVLVSLVCSVMMIPAALGKDAPTASLPMGMLLRADGLAVFMAIVSSALSAIIVLYSWSYISHYGHQNEYYLMVVLFLGAMMGLVYSSNLILLYIFWEITALASWRLIGFFREPKQVLRADKAFLVTIFGALAMLLGFILVGVQAQKLMPAGDGRSPFDLTVIHQFLGAVPLDGMAVVLILAGILAKSATLPFHGWLPDAGVAPSPVTALLHAAVLVKIGVYAFARLFVVTFTLSPYWHTAVMVIAAASALVSATAALVDTDLKRIIAYSTVSQIAFIFLGLAVGGNDPAVRQMAVAGGLLYILMHGIAKGGLFLCAGIVEQNTHTKDIRKLGGLVKTMPVTAVAFLLCSFSVMGIPPFGGFFSKYMVISGAAQSGQTAIALVFLAGAVLTILYLLRVFKAVFLSEPRLEPVKEGSKVMVACVAALGLLSLAAGIWINPSADFARRATEQIMGIVK
jgi:NADH:ubiquinone oxidoreductase subunit 5 (subunit L)/multisubunit Na+/H+ antiporter MnhA subunit